MTGDEERMINFTVGPVQSDERVRKIGSENTPYFRTSEFSEIMLENERLMKKFAHASDEARVVFITGSGTASMEAAVINTLDENDKALIVNGGSFGSRFVQICEIHKIPHTEIKLEAGTVLKPEHLKEYEGAGYAAFLVNMGETSTGVLYDMDMISDFCKRNHLFLIVDAISTFLTDPFDMQKSGAGVMLTGSQKALAVPPGVSIMVLEKSALDRIGRIDSGCLYLDLENALKNGERGQTPFTPAVTTLLQIHERLKMLDETGIEAELLRCAEQARDFREKVKAFPFTPFAEVPSNCVTSLKVENKKAKVIFETLKNEYGIWICPNGGDMGETVFRVGHIGALTKEDNQKLIDAFADLQKRGIF